MREKRKECFARREKRRAPRSKKARRRDARRFAGSAAPAGFPILSPASAPPGPGRRSDSPAPPSAPPPFSGAAVPARGSAPGRRRRVRWARPPAECIRRASSARGLCRNTPRLPGAHYSIRCRNRWNSHTAPGSRPWYSAAPPAMPYVAVAGSSGWSDSTSLLKYGFLMMFVIILVASFIGYPLANLIMPM